MPARARSEGKRLLQACARSVWAPASLEGGHVGHAGVGVVAGYCFCCFFFPEFFQLGRVLRCHLPISGGRVIHLVVVYGLQGASTYPEKLRLTEKLLDAVLCELAVVASGQPCLIVGDMNIVPHWFDLQSSWAAASGVAPLPTCCRSFGSCGGSRRDFVLGCPLAASAFEWCKVLRDRWVLPHYAVRASFSMGRWSARARLPVRFSVLWPAAWVACSDRSRGSNSVEVRRIWEVYDECLLSVHPAFWEGVRSSLLAGDVSSAWSVWSFSAEVSLVRAFVGAGGPVLEAGFRLGRGAAQFGHVSVGGPVVGKLRSHLGSGDGQTVHLFKDASVSRVIILRRRLGCVLSVLDGISRHGLTLSRDLELGVQWDATVAAGPCGPLCSANLAISPAVGLPFFGNHVRVLYDVVVDFMHKVVVYRGDVLVPGWRSWMLEDIRFILIVGFCDPGLTFDGSEVISDPDCIDEQFH